MHEGLIFLTVVVSIFGTGGVILAVSEHVLRPPWRWHRKLQQHGLIRLPDFDDPRWKKTSGNANLFSLELGKCQVMETHMGPRVFVDGEPLAYAGVYAKRMLDTYKAMVLRESIIEAD